jgi:hypothetical protein
VLTQDANDCTHPEMAIKIAVGKLFGEKVNANVQFLNFNIFFQEMEFLFRKV